MLYHAYQLQDDLISPVRFVARRMMAFSTAAFGGPGEELRRRMAAALEMIIALQDLP